LTSEAGLKSWLLCAGEHADRSPPAALEEEISDPARRFALGGSGKAGDFALGDEGAAADFHEIDEAGRFPSLEGRRAHAAERQTRLADGTGRPRRDSVAGRGRDACRAPVTRDALAGHGGQRDFLDLCALVSRQLIFNGLFRLRPFRIGALAASQRRGEAQRRRRASCQQ
jgi:hypothetical protein